MAIRFVFPSCAISVRPVPMLGMRRAHVFRMRRRLVRSIRRMVRGRVRCWPAMIFRVPIIPAPVDISCRFRMRHRTIHGVRFHVAVLRRPIHVARLHSMVLHGARRTFLSCRAAVSVEFSRPRRSANRRTPMVHGCQKFTVSPGAVFVLNLHTRRLEMVLVESSFFESRRACV